MTYYLRPVIPDDVDNGLLEVLDNLSIDSSCWNSVEAKQAIENIHNRGIYAVVAIADDRVIGAGTVFVEPKLIHKGGKVGHIEDVVTKAGYEGNGIGSGVVRCLLGVAKSGGCYKVILDCSRDNIPFYTSLGFREHETGMRIDL